MLGITVFDKEENCNELVRVKFAHISMFKENQMDLNFINREEQLKLMNVLIIHHVKFICEGDTISLLLNERQRVRVRFDSITS
jgi:hypothetical protein